jgi:Xaa-Pro aminopeptidase
LQSLCRSREREIESIDVVQLTFGAKYGGYCGNMCRPVVLGSIPLRQKEIIGVANDLFMETIESIRPGIAFATLYEHFQDRLKSEGLAGLSLYGPAHGTGLQECEGPWVDNRNDYSMQPGMIFNVDIWIADSKYGVRFEDGVLVTETGLENLSSWHRAPIELD